MSVVLITGCSSGVEVKRPKARYTVTPSATLSILQRQLTPDKFWDLAMRAQFPVPGGK